VLIYAIPDPERPGRYVPILAEDTGYEGIACVDDTARAALLALAVYERTQDLAVLRLARRWLTFVLYMQYPDGEFANFVRNASGRRNASGPTSVKGGVWWTARALWALARAYRVTGSSVYRKAYERCPKPDVLDGKIQALLALGEAELFRVDGESHREQLAERARSIASCSGDYFRDACDDPRVHLWGFHQLHAVATVARLLQDRALLGPCRRTVNELLVPVVRGLGYYEVGPGIEGESLPGSGPLRGLKEGLCAYCISPTVQGLAELYRATGAERYRQLGLRAGDWFSGRNDAHRRIYDPRTGLCADGIDGDVVSPNRGAESSIEAGFAELDRRSLRASHRRRPQPIVRP